MNSETTQQSNAFPPEAYPQAMNLIGQNLLKSLVQTVQNLPAPLRNNEVLLQALSAFLSNVLHQQFPKSQEARQQMLERLTKLVGVHLADLQK